VADEALDGPGRRVPQGADGLALYPLGQVPQQVYLVQLGVAARFISCSLGCAAQRGAGQGAV
jgi:hypothetical protein